MDVVLCEPYTTESDDVLTDFDYVHIEQPMIDAILAGGKRYTNDEGGNAYVFGELFPLEDYELIDSMGNDGAQVGLVDREDFYSDREFVAAFDAFEGDWDNREAFELLRAKYPFVLFVGATDGGDVGANLYSHVNEAGEVDSLIIDSDYFKIE